MIGRSIGTGPASHLASVRTIAALILASPYLSIRDIAKSKIGSWAKYLIKEKFRNCDKIPKVECPILFIHGMIDNLIPYTHSVELRKLAKGFTMENYIVNQGHSHFDVNTMVLPNLLDFFKEIDMMMFEDNKDIQLIDKETYSMIPDVFLKYPNHLKKKI